MARPGDITINHADVVSGNEIQAASWVARMDAFESKINAILADMVSQTDESAQAIAGAITIQTLLDINGSSVVVHTKYFIGSLDSDTITVVAHGLTYTKIRFVGVMVEDAGNTLFRVGGFQMGDGGSTNRYDISYNATNITFSNVGTNYQGDRYRIKIDYVD